MNNLLIISDKALDLSFLDEPYDFIKLYKASKDEILMDTYANDPERSSELRKTIEGYDPSRILVVGEMGEYIWLGTVLTSLFGKFNAWLGQYEQEHAETKLKVKGKEVPMLAIKSLADVNVYKEWERV